MFDPTAAAALVASLSFRGEGEAPSASAESVDTLAGALLQRVVATLEQACQLASEHDEDERRVGAGEIDLISACEQIVRMAQGTQAEAIQSLDARRRAATEHAVDESTLTRSLFTEIAMARQVSAPAGETSYVVARAFEGLPRTHDLLREGVISQAVATAVCRETTYADADDQRRIDAELATALPELTARKAAQETRRLVLAHDPHAAYERTVRARSDRAVSLHPELDAMATLRVYGPAEQLVAAYEHLDREAMAARSDGDPRTVRQLMADLAAVALAGASSVCGPAGPRRDSHGLSDDPGVRDGSDASDGSGGRASDGPRAGDRGARDNDGGGEVGGGPSWVPRVEVGLVMRPETLFGADDAPAVLEGYGPVAAQLARELATTDQAWLRRFFTTPDGEQVVGSDPRSRRFNAAVRRLVRVADSVCARPWCDCRIRAVDHITPYARGGPTSVGNAEGACDSSNLVKEAPGWAVKTVPRTAPPPTTAAPPNTAAPPTTAAPPSEALAPAMRWTTPTGHTYETRRGGALRASQVTAASPP